MPALKYTKAADAWQWERRFYEEDCGHSFDQPEIDNFAFSGTLYKATCKKCRKPLYVSGGWGGPSAFGPIAHSTCEPVQASVSPAD